VDLALISRLLGNLSTPLPVTETFSHIKSRRLENCHCSWTQTAVLTTLKASLLQLHFPAIVYHEEKNILPSEASLTTVSAVEVTSPHPATMEAIIDNLILPVVRVLVLNFVLPGWPLFNVLLILMCWYTEVWESLRCASAGYIDVLYLTHAHRRSFARINVVLATQVIMRALPPFWVFVRLFSSFLWKHAAVQLTLSLCFGTLWWFEIVPKVLRKKFQYLWELVTLWMILAPTNLMYGAIFIIGAISKAAGNAVRVIVNMRFSSLSAFSYSAAPDFDPTNQIRLLKLDRNYPFLEASAELISCTLQDAPPYHAISYAWTHGPQDLRTLKLNGMKLLVRGNVHDILVRCSSFYEPQLIWIDSICIDQGKLSEKTLQVRKMRDIYSKAAHVLVCLGNGPAYLAQDLMRELKLVRQSFGETYLVGHVMGFINRRKTDIYLRARVKALQDLLQHPWFRRIWVVQEFVVAQQVTICHGRQSIPWQEFYDSLKVLSGWMISTLLVIGTEVGPLDGVSTYIGTMSISFMHAYQKEYHTFGPQQISHLLRVFGEKEATMPVDKMFALIGMAMHYGSNLEQLVEYDEKIKTKDAALLELAAFLLDHGEAQNVLDLAGIGWSMHNSNLPSWAVDWTVMRFGKPLSSTFSPSGVRFQATTGKTPRVFRGSARDELVARGQYVDRIRSIVPISSAEILLAQPHEGSIASLVTYPDVTLALAQQYAQSPYPCRGMQPLEEAVWRTLIGDKTDSVRPAPVSCGQTVKTHLRLLQDLGRISTSYSPSVFMNQATRDKLQASVGLAKLDEIRKSLEDFQEIDLLFDSGKGSSPHVFCVTDNGYIGMVPQLSEPGDLVSLIYGLDVVYVLRKSAEKYQLVGDAYVHGMMDGEGLKLGHAEVDFVLV
jgi:hypothetical protein